MKKVCKFTDLSKEEFEKLLESMRSRNPLWYQGVHMKGWLMRLYWHTMVDVMMGQFT